VEYVVRTNTAESTTSVRLLKNDTDQRYVLGVVLEPETVDAQNDIYSVDEVMKSAHTFLAEFRNAGLQHQTLVNDKVRIVESYLAPADFSLNGEPVKKGTWLIGMIVDDESIWKAIKSGALTGFSIGGSAVRTGA
jgi:DNA adenine methylase